VPAPSITQFDIKAKETPPKQRLFLIVLCFVESITSGCSAFFQSGAGRAHVCRHIKFFKILGKPG
jgi:hypothetical protein